MAVPLYLGLDFGTSGARACLIAGGGEIDRIEQVPFGALDDNDRARVWQAALVTLIEQIPSALRSRIAALAIDGTSGTILACAAADARPLTPALMYDDARAVDESREIAAVAGADHPVVMPTSALAKARWLHAQGHMPRGAILQHQADWLAALLTGRVGFSDRHNALKLGFDPADGWPNWIDRVLPPETLPEVVLPGAALASARGLLGKQLGLTSALVRAGTTDSIAAFLATGVAAPGEAVSALGSTLAVKLVSPRRVDSARYGVYSHWFGRYWLAGGASNAGGAVLRQFFTDAALAQLSAQIDPSQSSGLAYYPLPKIGERFPEADPHKRPVLTPQPDDPLRFLHGLLEGLARIEAAGYRRLAELGAPPVRAVYSTGGGAANSSYTRLRARALGVPVFAAEQQAAAYGAARLACFGEGVFPL
ncbi:FGGY-family carbohydrate kinase [Halothiobacillus sp. DCM-1]|uniref:FGGY-family carbohydrate kinase n=1 Tax=Halothiobacillus sp. DCM-1 TaxID=3112558 RepID=UPI003243F0E2